MLLSRFDAVSAELGRVQAGATSMRQQLEHLNGPAGPAARVRQLEALLQSVSVTGSCSRSWHADARDMRVPTAAAGTCSHPLPRTHAWLLLLLPLQAARKCEAAEARASKAAAEAAELGARLRAAEDEIIALEGQTSILESELQRHT